MHVHSENSRARLFRSGPPPASRVASAFGSNLELLLINPSTLHLIALLLAADAVIGICRAFALCTFIIRADGFVNLSWTRRLLGVRCGSAADESQRHQVSLFELRQAATRPRPSP